MRGGAPASKEFCFISTFGRFPNAPLHRLLQLVISSMTGTSSVGLSTDSCLPPSRRALRSPAEPEELGEAGLLAPDYWTLHPLPPTHSCNLSSNRTQRPSFPCIPHVTVESSVEIQPIPLYLLIGRLKQIPIGSTWHRSSEGRATPARPKPIAGKRTRLTSPLPVCKPFLTMAQNPSLWTSARPCSCRM